MRQDIAHGERIELGFLVFYWFFREKIWIFIFSFVFSGILEYGFGIIHLPSSVPFPLEMKINLVIYQSLMLPDGEELGCLHRSYFVYKEVRRQAILFYN